MVTQKPDLIIFDLDDTLVPADSVYDFAMKDLGISVDDKFFLQAREKVKANLPAFAPVARSRFLYLKTYLEMTDNYSAQKSLSLAEQYESKVIAKMTEAWKKLNRSKLFTALKSKGYHLAVLSNETCRFQTKKLAAFESGDHFFEMLLTSEERGVEKPQPVLFYEMLKYFKLDAKDALMVGDSFENDITPCVKMGISCIQSVEFRKSKSLHSNTIETLDQILEFL